MERMKSTKTPNWAPLEKAVPTALLADFMHMGEVGTVQLYKHRDTRRYHHIDSDCTRFYDWSDDDGEGRFCEISRNVALLDVLEATPCAVPLHLLGLAPASFRAASMLTAFLDFQGNVWRWEIYKPDEAHELVRALSSIGRDLAGFARIITGELNERHGEESFALASARIRETIEGLQVPADWLLPPGEDDCLTATVVRGWQAFCDRLAAEVGAIPFYGLALSEVPVASQESLQRPVGKSPEAEHQGIGLWRRIRELLGL